VSGLFISQDSRFKKINLTPLSHAIQPGRSMLNGCAFLTGLLNLIKRNDLFSEIALVETFAKEQLVNLS